MRALTYIVEKTYCNSLDVHLIEFVSRCSTAGVTPAEKEIDAFLNSIDRIDLRDFFIKWCFINWDDRHEYLNL